MGSERGCRCTPAQCCLWVAAAGEEVQRSSATPSQMRPWLQGHILEKLEDPAEVERMLLHMRSKSTFGDTMADTIL